MRSGRCLEAALFSYIKKNQMPWFFLERVPAAQLRSAGGPASPERKRWTAGGESVAPLVGFRLLRLTTSSRFGSPASSPNIAPAFDSHRRIKQFIRRTNKKSQDSLVLFGAGREN